jgi:cbb3-type cytochrome oxidase maturation protein
MDVIAYLIPIAIFLGAVGLAAFFWALKHGQFDDPDGAAQRILFDDDDTEPSAGASGPGEK